MQSYALTYDEQLCAEAVARSRGIHVAGTSKVRQREGDNNVFFLGKKQGLPKKSEQTSQLQYRSDYSACVAEIVVSRLLNLAWTGCGKTEACDVGNYIEVRSVRNMNHGLVVRPRDSEYAPFVLVDVVGMGGTIRGWAWKSEVVKNGYAMAQGTDNPYWILRDRLHGATELLTIVADESYRRCREDMDL